MAIKRLTSDEFKKLVEENQIYDTDNQTMADLTTSAIVNKIEREVSIGVVTLRKIFNDTTLQETDLVTRYEIGKEILEDNNEYPTHVVYQVGNKYLQIAGN